MPNKKSLGLEGLTGEYYKNIKLILGPYLHEVLETATASASFPAEMLEALIVTLPKPGKSLDSPKNCRPISLLNKLPKNVCQITSTKINEYLTHTD